MPFPVVKLSICEVLSDLLPTTRSNLENDLRGTDVHQFGSSPHWCAWSQGDAVRLHWDKWISWRLGLLQRIFPKESTLAAMRDTPSCRSRHNLLQQHHQLVVIPFAGSDRRHEVSILLFHEEEERERDKKESKRVLNSILFLQSCFSRSLQDPGLKASYAPMATLPAHATQH